MNILGKGMRDPPGPCWSVQGHSPAGWSMGSTHGMKGAVIQEASAHRSWCDGLTMGIYVAFKCINKGVLNNRKRGDFTFIAAPLKPGLK